MAKRDIVIVLLIIALIGGMWGAVTYLDNTEHAEQTEMVYNAVKKAALTCYAVEGAYPSRVDYLEENYGLSYDHELYLVSYNAFASNLFPDVRVIEQKAGT
ncbi:MAG: hypothetical protein J6D53_10050 [Blautia sp.]|nr:hypothetical protein [Blautia sp.]